MRYYNADILSLDNDEAISGRAAIGLLDRGYPSMVRYDGSINIYDRSWLHSVLLAISYKLFGIDTLSTRLPGILWGTIIIPLSYIFGKFFGNKETGFCLAVIVAILPWEIATSRYTRFYSQFQTLFLISSILFYVWYSKYIDLQRKNNGVFINIANKINLWIVLWAIIVIMGYYTHQYFLLMLVIPLLFVAIRLFKTIDIKNNFFKDISLILIPIILFISLVFLKTKLLVLVLNTIYNIVSLNVDYYNLIMIVIEYIPPHIWILSFFAFIGILLVLVYEKEKGVYISLSFMVTLLLILLLVPAIMGSIRERYATPLLPFMLFLSSYSISHFSKKITNIHYNNIIPSNIHIYSIMFIFILLIVPIPQTLMYVQPIEHGNNLPYTTDFNNVNLKGASEFVLANMDEKDAIYVRGANSLTFYFGWDSKNIRKMELIEYWWPDPPEFHPTIGHSITNQTQLKNEIKEDRSVGGGAWFVLDSWKNIPKEIRYWIETAGTKIEFDKTVILYYIPESLNLITFDEERLEYINLSGYIGIIDQKNNSSNYLVLYWEEDIENNIKKINYPNKTNTDNRNNGNITLKVELENENKMETRCYGAFKGEQYTRVFVSANNKKWKEVINNTDSGWQIYDINLSKIVGDAAPIYIKIEGGSQGDSKVGGLVDYIRIY